MKSKQSIIYVLSPFLSRPWSHPTSEASPANQTFSLNKEYADFFAFMVYDRYWTTFFDNYFKWGDSQLHLRNNSWCLVNMEPARVYIH